MQHNSRRDFLCSLGAAGAALGALPLRASAEPLQKLNLLLDWYPWGVHAPIFLPQQKGWFKEAGLDVTISDGTGSAKTVQIVGGGQFDLGHAALSNMAIATNKGVSLISFADFVRKGDIGLLIPRDSGMKTVKELKGKKVGYTAGSLEAPFIDAFLKAGGLTRDDVNLINIDASAKIATYAAGRTDATFTTIPFVLPIIEATRPSEAILLSDYGLQMPSFGLFTTASKLREHGPALRKFASIVAGAWRYIIDGHEDEGVRAIREQRPEAKLSPAILRGEIDQLKARFLSTDATKNVPIGFQNDALWASAIKAMEAASVIKPGSKPSDYFTNDYLDRAMIAQAATGKLVSAR
jgi:NitT/TauT family transport system substrate-binding protein